MQSTKTEQSTRADLATLWDKIDDAYRLDESQCVSALLPMARFDPKTRDDIGKRAKPLISNMRSARKKTLAVDAFLYEYSLSTEEGIALMCLAEALLRIPDNSTREKLINDKISSIDWQNHVGKSERLFINAATMGLMLTGNVMKQRQFKNKELGGALDRVLKRGGRTLVMQAMKVLGKQFVLGETISEALQRARKRERQGYRYSYDMLGEAAITKADAEYYQQAYTHAIEQIGKQASEHGPIHAPGISIKLSALHPRYEYAQEQRVMTELYQRLIQLCMLAKQYDISVTIDAEEAARLTLSLALFEKLMRDPALSGWDGLGLAVQSYQKRAPAVIDWLIALGQETHRRIMIRLIKGAYWDYEIKDSQVNGFAGYPVYTRKVATDVSFLACAKKIIQAGDVFYPQFATHNAHSVAAILECMKGRRDFEFQCLHGMGDALYDQLVGPEKQGLTCRIYAPVGEHEQLLPYLVRRLLENGANSSFVNRIHDEGISIEEMASDPVEKLASLAVKAHPNIHLPVHIYHGERVNSLGLDFSQASVRQTSLRRIHETHNQSWLAHPLISKPHELASLPAQVATTVVSPANRQWQIGSVEVAQTAHVQHALDQAEIGLDLFQQYSVEQRASLLETMAGLLQQHQLELMSYCIYEAGKTINDALSEIREAIDFCRYYACIGRQQLAVPEVCVGVTGERNELHYHPRGIVVAISPWNFPVAIFLGQVSAALMAGNVVIAKPAEQTPIIATKVVSLLHEAGFPASVVQCCPGPGETVGAQLIQDPRVRAVLFTGSTETARLINIALANKSGPITPLIAETGGQNAMFVDSSALLEQVVKDVVLSAFGSAGQRCSACRVVFVQVDVLERFKTMLSGAMDELTVGYPDAFNVDVGPVIDAEAQANLLAHIKAIQPQAQWCHQTPVNEAVISQGYFVPPTAVEIADLSLLTQEHFGPILHIIAYAESEMENCLMQLHQTGYGLTMGIHSRIDKHIDWLCAHAQVGNIYVNRNMIGAVVGAQPFGGEGLSGTGPKAGGPNYLKRLTVERVISTNTTATGGNTALLMQTSNTA